MLSLKTKGGIYRSCIRSVMLHMRETWCLWENEIVSLKRIENTIKAMGRVKLIAKRSVIVSK